MPIYEFKCKDCGEEFEVYLKNREETLNLVCKVCKSKNLERLMSIAHALVSSSEGSSEKPQISEQHSCPTGTCTHLDLPGYSK